MRILLGLVICGMAGIGLSGCGGPEAEFAWSNDTQDLMPAAQKATKAYVTERFGTPAKMVAWQRLPIAFGGMPGRVTEIYRDEDNDLIAALQVDFLAPAMIAKYDANLDGQLSLAEFPVALQKEITPEKYQQADANGDGFLSPAEVNKLRIRSDLFIKDTLSRIDEEIDEESLAEEAEDELREEQLTEAAKNMLIHKELLFVNGTYNGQKTTITDVKLDETRSSATVTIWPPLSDQPSGKEEAVDLTFDEVIVDFGRTMRSGRHLYMRHCMHCHGVTGDGDGPTAKYLSPLPRDYRKGLFKFISTKSDTVRRPTRDDLTRTLRHGIPGTYMPSFAMLTDQEVEDIIEYVRWLAMRGEYEGKLNGILGLEFSNKVLAQEIRSKLNNYELALEQFEGDLAEGKKTESDRPKAVTESSIKDSKKADLEEFLNEDLDEEIDSEANYLAENWRDAQLQSNVVYPTKSKPPSTPDSIARGRQLFLKQCVNCHGAMAEGNGENTRGYNKNPQTNEDYSKPGLFDDWGHPIQPRNLTLGIYRGGRRPLDIYRRISQGIPGTPMQAFRTSFSDEQIWDLVDYVMSVPIDGAAPRSPDKTLVALQSASELPGKEPAEKQPGEPKDKEQPGEKKPAVADSNRDSKPNEDNDE